MPCLYSYKKEDLYSALVKSQGDFMKLSIITICYNEKEIKRTCERIVQQTNKDFEWIVIDGASDKWCLDILKKYQSNMAYFISEKDSGIYNAMNKGILQAKGEFLLFLNAGDELCDNTIIEKVMPHLDSSADIFYANANFALSEREDELKSYPEKLTKIFFIDGCICHQAAFIKRELFDTHGLYNEKNKIVSDWEHWLKFCNGNCIFKHINILAASFYCDGLSWNNREQTITEQMSIIGNYFTKEDLLDFVEQHRLKELEKSLKEPIKTTSISLFNTIKLLEIVKDTKTKKIFFCGIKILEINVKRD